MFSVAKVYRAKARGAEVDHSNIHNLKMSIYPDSE